VKQKTLGLAAAAVVCLGLGYLWSMWFPLNKNLWTSSYVLVSAGWSLTLFALVYWAVEQQGWGKEGLGKAVLWPWLVFGSNAIAAYMVSELLPGVIENLPFSVGGHKTDALSWAHAHLLGVILDPGWRAFAYSVSYTAICFIPVWILYRKKIFLKV
jgi:predicted acyltransferase